MNFGWLKDNTEYETNNLIISVLPSYEQSIAEVENSVLQDGKWFHPLTVNNKLVDRFELPLTHKITHKSKIENTDFLQFVLFYFGWLNGQRLNPEGWGHLTKTAIKVGSLTDFVFSKKTIPKLLGFAESYWTANQSVQEPILLMSSALHWYLFAHSYERYFEKFMAQYMVTDTLYKIASLQLGKKCFEHISRIEFLAKELNLTCPSWGVVNGKVSTISEIRNRLFHESAFAGSPIGFSYSDFPTDLLVQLEAFNCRLIATLIGAKGIYSRSSCETMQFHGFDVD